MKRRRFWEEQIVVIPREVEKGEHSVVEVCCRNGIVETTSCWRRNRFESMDAPDVKRLLAERDVELGAAAHWST